jgi:hypothetical protein
MARLVPKRVTTIVEMAVAAKVAGSAEVRRKARWREGA